MPHTNCRKYRILLADLIFAATSSTCVVDLFGFNFGLSQPTGRTKAIHVI